jgi:hypothetical protein
MDAGFGATKAVSGLGKLCAPDSPCNLSSLVRKPSGLLLSGMSVSSIGALLYQLCNGFLQLGRLA